VKKLGFLLCAFALFLLPHQAHAQSSLERCQAGQCFGFGAPAGPSQNGYIYQDLSQTPPALYCAKTQTWAACGGSGGGSSSLADNVLLNATTTGKLFIETDSIGLISHGGFPEDLATLLSVPTGNQSINAIGSASLPDMLSCHTAGAGNCTQDGAWPLTFPLGVTTNSKVLLEAAYNDLSNMVSTPTNNQLSYYFGGLKAWLLEFGIPDSQKLAANGAYCTATGTWTAVSAVPGGSGTFPTGTIQTSTPGATLVCTTRNATDAGIIGYKSTGSTAATYTVNIVNAGTTYNVSDPYTGSTTLNQTAAYTTAWAGTANLYATGQAGMAGGYTTTTLTAANNSSDPVIVVAPYFTSPSSSLQNFPAVEVMLESRAGCNGACSSVAGAQHNDTNTNIMRTAQVNAVNELRSNGLNVSYFDPNATPSGFNSSDATLTPDGTHPNNAGGQLIANVAFVNFNSAATTQEHFLPAVAASIVATTCPGGQFVSTINSSGAAICTTPSGSGATGCGAAFAHHAAITLATATGGADLTNFPVLLGFNGATTNSLTLTNLKTVANSGQVQSSTGLDVIFCTASNAGTQLSHELVAGSYVASTGAGEWYVDVPTISHTTGTAIYAFWGLSGAADTSSVAAVWANGYEAVYHGGTSASLALTDSTANANTLTNHGAVAAAGEMGGAFSVTSSTYLADASPTGLPTGTTQRTIEAWVKIPVATGGEFIPFGYGGATAGLSYAIDEIPNTGLIGTFDASGAEHSSFTADTAWHHIASVLPSGQVSTSGTLMYLDGANIASVSCSTLCSATMTTPNTNVEINGVPGASSPPAAGAAETVDEFRISNVARTAGWESTQFANQSNPATFLTVGTIF
jgi:hypothetical protein